MSRYLNSMPIMVLLLALGSGLALIDPAETTVSADPAKQDLPVELQYVPVDSALFLAIDAAQVLDHPILKAFRKADPRTYDRLVSAAKMTLGVSPENVKSLALFMPKIESGSNGKEGIGAVITFRAKYDREKLARGIEELLPKNAASEVVAINDRTALVLINLGEEFARPRPVNKTGPLARALQSAAEGKHALVLGMTPAQFPEIFRGDELPSQLRPFQPLLNSTAITATLDLGKSLDLKVHVTTATSDRARECQKSLGTLLGLVQEEIGEELKSVESDAAKKPALKDLAATLKEVSKAIAKVKYSTSGSEVEMSLSLSAELPLINSYLALRERAEAEAAVETSANHLKQIALSMHNYADNNNDTLPPAAICDKTGKPLLSWRVLILPYIDQEALFKEFKLDEAWDSEHNTKLLARMPRVFAMPGLTRPGDTETYYRVFVGNGAGFDWKKGPRFQDIADGTSQTVMIVTAVHPVPWTKPDELAFDPDKDMRNLIGEIVNGKAQVALFDGSVHTLKKIPSKETMHALITRAGGEVIGNDFP